MNTLDKKALDKKILSLALPALGSLIIQPLLLVVDSVIVGWIHSDAIAGLGVSLSIITIFIGLSIFLAYGTTSTVAKQVGAKQYAKAISLGYNGMILGFILGIIFGLLILFFTPMLAKIFDSSPEALTYARDYLNIMAFALPFGIASLAGTGFIRGFQETKPTFYISAIALVINATSSIIAVFIFNLGIFGVGLGTLIAHVFSAYAYFNILNAKRKHYKHIVDIKIIPILAAAKSGLPIVWRTLMLLGTIFTATYSSSRLGVNHLAAHHLIYTLWFTLAYFLDSIAIAAQALIGKAFGEENLIFANQIRKRTIYWGLVLGGGTMVFIFTIIPWYGSLFTSNEIIHDILHTTLWIVAIQQIFAGATYALDGILLGAGAFLYLAIIQTIAFLISLPFLYIAIFFWQDIRWIWTTLFVWMIFRSILLLRYKLSLPNTVTR